MLEDLIEHRPSRVDYEPTAAQVVTVNLSTLAVFVAPIGGDRQHPIGPCLGQKTKFKTFTAVTGVSGSPAVVSSSEPAAVKRVPIAVGDMVLLLFTDAGPWIVAVDE